MSDYDDKNPMGRYWATILYDESVAKDFDSIIKSWCVPCFMIPHEPESEDKKYHYHVMVMFPSNKRRNYVKKLFDELHGVGCEQIRDKIGYARYLIHKDNPEKKQYLPDDVYCYGGANYELFISTASDEISELQLLTEVIDLITDNDIIHFKNLVNWARMNNRLDILKFCMNKTNFIVSYMRSMEYANRPTNDS